ncbi:LysR substrate-binding domain-containing protein [Ponticaulis profundi]|uniref:LysR substrate-binding domain-containing protein n=1 Tax=Ponticaulis profundi TaxID=2665222 RepID=A0ABW1S7U9_9PROT
MSGYPLQIWAGIDVFLAVAEAGSFTRAANQLGVSVSFVSRQLSMLEEHLGTRLLSRTTRRVDLTEAGARFETNCRRLIADRDEALRDVSTVSDELRGPLRITCSIAFGERMVVPVLNRFVSEHPGISVDIDLSNTVVDIVANGFDIAIRTGHITDNRLASHHITSRTLHMCASPDYLSRRGEPEAVEDLDRHVCLLGTSREWQLRVANRSVSYRPQGRWRCNNGFGVLDAAERGLGICQLPDFYVRDALADGRLVEVLPTCRPDAQKVWGVYANTTRKTRMINILLGELEGHLARPELI